MPAPPDVLIDPTRVVDAFFDRQPDPAVPAERVQFGTSGHRGASLCASFNEAHILAIVQAICELRASNERPGPLFLGADTHALSEPARVTAHEVLAANGVHVFVDQHGGYTPTPAVSRAIVEYNRERASERADGIVVTPSHNPPGDGGIKYSPPHGGPAAGELTRKIERRANALLEAGLRGVKRTSLGSLEAANLTTRFDYIAPYVAGLVYVVDLEAIRNAHVRVGVDPMGGSGLAYLDPIAERYGIHLDVVNRTVDPTFAFMPLDHDGKIRMDCSSPYAMAGLVGLKDRYDIAFGNDTDFDRHGIVTPSAGLMNPNHYLAVAIDYLLSERTEWPAKAAIGKTLVSSAMIDRVADHHHRRLAEVPVGFKWFVDGLSTGAFCFGGEESAGATFLARDGSTWTTDKDGIILGLLAAEIIARRERDPGELYRRLTERFGDPVYQRVDAPATPEQKAALERLQPEDVTATTLAGDRILHKQSTAPEGHTPIGGLKVTTANGWFAARPSGTEDVYKIYAESFVGSDHLSTIQEEARAIVGAALEAG